MALMNGIMDLQAIPFVAMVAVAVLGALTLWLMKEYHKYPTIGSNLPPIPKVPGLPLFGNLLQLKEDPHKTFLIWAKTYGPIYSIKTGSKTIVVINDSEIAEEAMITKFSSINTKKVTKSIETITADKRTVDFSDYGDYHKTAKRHLVTSVLGTKAQRRHRGHRDLLIGNILKFSNAHVKDYPLKAISIGTVFQLELFGLTLRQALGKDVHSIYVEELGTTFSRKDLLKVLVGDIMDMVIDEDWREIFPYLKWVPNKSYERKLDRIVTRGHAVMDSLIKEQTKRLVQGEEIYCYLDYLSSEGNTLSAIEKTMLVWETFIETTENTSIAFEWAMYEISKDPKRQERLYEEIYRVCGSGKIVEQNLSQLPYLLAVFHETLRKYSPVLIAPLRFVHEDIELGGYHVPAGSEIALNFYGCNMDEKMWVNPQEWNPERFLDEKFDSNDFFKTMAFGGGKRACTGTLQAMLITCTAIARLVQEFEWILKEGEEDAVKVLTARKLEPVFAYIKPRKQ